MESNTDWNNYCSLNAPCCQIAPPEAATEGMVEVCSARCRLLPPILSHLVHLPSSHVWSRPSCIGWSPCYQPPLLKSHFTKYLCKCMPSTSHPAARGTSRGAIHIFALNKMTFSLLFTCVQAFLYPPSRNLLPGAQAVAEEEGELLLALTQPHLQP